MDLKLILITKPFHYNKERCDFSPFMKVSINVLCEYSNQGIECKYLIQPGTTAKISCAVGYEKPKRQVSDEIKCNLNGQWNDQPWECDEVCGEIKLPRANIVGGTETEIDKVPWQTVIYRKDEKTNQLKFICGGSIITSRFVISGNIKL